MRLNRLSTDVLIRYHRVSFKLLTKYQSKRAWKRLQLVVVQLDNRGIVYE